MPTYLDPTDVCYSFSIGSLSRFIQKIFNDSIFVIEPATTHYSDLVSVIIMKTPPLCLCFYNICKCSSPLLFTSQCTLGNDAMWLLWLALLLCCDCSAPESYNLFRAQIFLSAGAGGKNGENTAMDVWEVALIHMHLPTPLCSSCQ